MKNNKYEKCSDTGTVKLYKRQVWVSILKKVRSSEQKQNFWETAG